MSQQSQQDIKAIVADVVRLLASRTGVDFAGVNDDTDLFAAGIIDSFGFFELIEGVEGRIGKRIELDALGDRDIGTIGGIARQIARISGS